jgi:hypothetical protein
MEGVQLLIGQLALLVAAGFREGLAEGRLVVLDGSRSPSRTLRLSEPLALGLGSLERVPRSTAFAERFSQIRACCPRRGVNWDRRERLRSARV